MSFFHTNKIGAPNGELLGKMNPKSNSFANEWIALASQEVPYNMVL